MRDSEYRCVLEKHGTVLQKKVCKNLNEYCMFYSAFNETITSLLQKGRTKKSAEKKNILREGACLDESTQKIVICKPQAKSY